MSHNDNHNLLILILFLLFPEVFIFLGLGYILFYIVVGIAYLIYIFFVPILVIGAIIFIIYALGNKKNNPKIQTDKPKDTPRPDKSTNTTEKSLALDYNTDSGYDSDGPEVDEEKQRIMEEYDLDEDDAERVQEIAEEWGIDEDEAAELIDDL